MTRVSRWGTDIGGEPTDVPDQRLTARREMANAGSATSCAHFSLSNTKPLRGAAPSTRIPAANAMSPAAVAPWSGQASCTASGDNINIGIGDPTNGVGAVVTNTDPPAVHAVGLGNPNGSVLGYSDAAQSQGNAEATKVGNSYKITGTAVGVDPSNSQSVTKPFEMDVACP